MKVGRAPSRQAAGLSSDAAAPRRAMAGQACAAPHARARLLAGLLQLAADEHLVQHKVRLRAQQARSRLRAKPHVPAHPDHSLGTVTMRP
jgi:hypothetical protein